ncbi:hypothetical protein ACH4U5_30365 [Streptomyces sp. NPDC020858]|uniref:hypothetical protein n=1 Tax=Streptomyces sp. NPDC020858 TaxID=3365097 RepID=UPI0037951E99
MSLEQLPEGVEVAAEARCHQRGLPPPVEGLVPLLEVAERAADGLGEAGDLLDDLLDRVPPVLGGRLTVRDGLQLGALGRVELDRRVQQCPRDIPDLLLPAVSGT